MPTGIVHEEPLGKVLCNVLLLFVAALLVFTRPLNAQTSDASQIEILNITPGTNPPLAPSSPVNQLLELNHQKQWSDAAKLGQKLVEEHPREPIIYENLGLARIHLRDPIGAVQALRAAQRLGLDTADLHVALGLAYIAMNQYVLFEQQMHEAIQLNPANYLPRYCMGRYLESTRNDYAGALEYFEEATKLAPRDAKSWCHQGYCLEALGRRADALGAYELAIQCVEQKHESFSLPDQGMARLLLESKPAQALQYARKAIALQPDLGSNHLVMARIYEKLGELSNARNELNAATRLDPSSAAPWFILARVSAKLGDQKSAKAQLNMFRKINQTYGPQ